MSARQIDLRGGRRLGLTGLGDPLARRLVILFHPMPGSGDFDPDPAVTRHWGVHVLGFDRPGYGSSDPVSSSTEARFTLFADDLHTYLSRAEMIARTDEATDFGAVGVVGWGVGGLAAAAFAARHPQAVDRLVLIDTPYRPQLSRYPERSGMTDLCVTGDEPTGPAGAAHRVARMLESSRSQRSAGTEFDRRAVRRFPYCELRHITADTILIYGTEHPLVSASADGHPLSRRIRGSRVIRASGSRALAISAHWERVLAHVAPHHGDVPASLR